MSSISFYYNFLFYFKFIIYLYCMLLLSKKVLRLNVVSGDTILFFILRNVPNIFIVYEARFIMM